MSNRFLDESLLGDFKKLHWQKRNIGDKIKHATDDAFRVDINPFRKKSFAEKIGTTDAYRGTKKSLQNLHNATPTAMKVAIPTVIAAGLAATIIKAMHDKKKKKEKKDR